MKKHILIWLLLLITAPLMAQQARISGRVTDAETGDGLPGAAIQVQGTTRGVITDFDGNFALEASPGEVLLISFLGYEPQRITVGNQTSLSISLAVAADALEEVVVMGYTTQKRKDLTGSVAVVDVDDLGVVPYANVLQSLQGRVAGVTISQDGQPGSGRTQMRIRGATTLNNNTPLYVIDGIATTEPLDNLNPNDIESIQVLKDAAAASIYGSRSAAGVIVITTKKGRGESMNVEAGVVRGIQTLPRQVEVLNSQEWGEMYWRAARYSNRTPNLALYGGRVDNPQVVTTPFPVPGTDQFYQFSPEGTNWADEVYRTAANNQYFVNVNSGTKRGAYSLGFSYFDQEGIINHTNYERLTGRINSSFDLAPWLRIGENVSISWSDQVQVGTQNTGGGIPYQVIRQHPALPIYDTDGNYAGGNIMVGGLAFPNSMNPVAVLDRNRNNNSRSWRIFGNAYLEADVLKALPALSDAHGLLLRSNFGLDYSNFFGRNFEPTFREGGFINEIARFSNNFGEGVTRTWINTAEYTYNTNRHSFKTLLGHEAVAYDFRGLNAANSGYTIEDPNYVQIGSGLDPIGGGGAEDWGLLSYFGRVEYGFDDRYLLSATLRHDRTSRLRTSGVFPAISLGWNLDQESFARPLFENNWISSFKLRGSWGQQGNQNIPTYGIYSTFGPNRDRADYDFNGDNATVDQGYIVYQRGNLDLRWETTTQTNIGFDTRLLDRSLELNVDFYLKRTEDILRAPATIAAEGEGGRPFRNTATMENRGVDLALTYYWGSPGDKFNFSTLFQFSAYRNKVIDLGPGVGAVGLFGEQYELYDGETRAATGYAFPTFYGWVANGIFQNENEVEAHAEQPGKAPGRIRYADLNGDGVIDEQDRTYLGSPHPDFTLGLSPTINWGNLSFSFFVYASKGNDVYNYTRQNTDFFEPNFNVGRRILDAWSPDNPGSSIPAAQLTATNNERRPSSYFVEDASFIRLRTVRLGYNLPLEAISKQARVTLYGEVQNALTITGYTGLDPEVPFAGDANVWGVDRGFYPLPRTFMLGLTVGL
jgi:TonB-dependent starch-binding outer membrane protein SusC